MTLTDTILGSIALLSTTALRATQGASEPVRSAPESFVTADGDHAHLGVREGLNLRAVGHAASKNCPNEFKSAHRHGDGHEHAK